MKKNFLLLLSTLGFMIFTACSDNGGTIPIPTPDPVITASETDLCTDGLDNDGDSLIDCSDTTDCIGDAACSDATAEVCNDLVDNDGDAAIDCADTDCTADTTACPPSTVTETLCTDTLDDDADGTIDCLDPDCAADTACGAAPVTVEILCNDLADDDADGDMDCDDSDCAADALCADADADGFLANSDCDDTNAEINLDAREIMGNGIDENCDGTEFSLTDTSIKWIRAEGGTDNPTCAVEQPCLTLGHVVKNVALNPKDTIAMIEGTYVLDHFVKIDRPINIIGAIFQDGETYKFDEVNHATKIFTNSYALLVAAAGVPWDQDRVRLNGLDINTEGGPSEFTIIDSSPDLNHVALHTERAENSNGAMLIISTAATSNMRVSIRNSNIQMGPTYRTTPGAVLVNPIAVVNFDGKLNLEIVKSHIGSGEIEAAVPSLAVGLMALNFGTNSRMNVKLHENVISINTSDMGIGVMGNNISDASIRQNHIVIAKDTKVQAALSIKGRPAGLPEKLSVMSNFLKTNTDGLPALASIGIASKNINVLLGNNTIDLGKSLFAVNASHRSAPGAGDKYKLLNNILLNDAASSINTGLWTFGIANTDFILKAVKNNDFFGGTGAMYFNLPTATPYNDVASLEGYLNTLIPASATGNLSVAPLMTFDNSGEIPVIGLEATSPLIDAGLTPPPPVGNGPLPQDGNGNPRVTDGNGDGTKVIDIGAAEYQPATL